MVQTEHVTITKGFPKVSDQRVSTWCGSVDQLAGVEHGNTAAEDSRGIVNRCLSHWCLLFFSFLELKGSHIHLFFIPFLQ